jgi:hypothetical protein
VFVIAMLVIIGTVIDYRLELTKRQVIARKKNDDFGSENNNKDIQTLGEIRNGNRLINVSVCAISCTADYNF